MKVYQTNAALGYLQLAFLIRLEKSKNGYNYLCVGTQCVYNDNEYEVGRVVLDLEDIYVAESEQQLSCFEINKNYLFTEWLNQRKQLNEAIEALKMYHECCSKLRMPYESELRECNINAEKILRNEQT